MEKEKENEKEADKLVDKSQNQHGPPANTSPDLDVELKRKEDEIRRLQADMQIYIGKLKGYQTLGHLFQEAKQECSRYKQQNEQLANKLENLTKHLSTTSIHGLATSVDQPGSNTISMAMSGATPVVMDAATITESQMTVGGRDVATATSDGSMRGMMEEAGLQSRAVGGGWHAAASDKDTSSSPSFVQINSPLTSLPSVASGIASQSGERASTRGSENISIQATDVDNGDMSPKIQQLYDHLSDANSSPESRSVTTELIAIGLKAMKMEKQAKVKQTLLEQMSAEMQTLKSESERKQEIIDQLHEERDQLLTRVARLERERDSIMEASAAHSSMEYVQVEKLSSSGTAPAERITTVSTTEIDLRRKLDRMDADVKELKKVNLSWDEHCRKRESEHLVQTTLLQQELNDSRRRLEDYRTGDMKRQQDIDNMLLAAKKQRENYEMEKDDALQQLSRERHLRQELEQQCAVLRERNAELDLRVQQQSSNRLESIRETMSAAYGSAAASGANVDPTTELQILREQVTLFKEDFDNERRDRERAKAESDSLRIQWTTLVQEVRELKSQNQKASDELKCAKVENSSLRTRLQRTVDELLNMQTQVRPMMMNAGNMQTRPAQMNASNTAPVYVTPVVAQPYYYGPAGGASPGWSCLSCTYQNPMQRGSCEMCGAMAPARGSAPLARVQQEVPELVARAGEFGGAVAGPQFHPNQRYGAEMYAAQHYAAPRTEGQYAAPRMVDQYQLDRRGGAAQMYQPAQQPGMQRGGGQGLPQGSLEIDTPAPPQQ